MAMPQRVKPELVTELSVRQLTVIPAATTNPHESPPLSVRSPATDAQCTRTTRVTRAVSRRSGIRCVVYSATPPSPPDREYRCGSAGLWRVS